MKYTLYAVEVAVSFDPMTYELVTRVDEKGPGSPLVWTDKADAEKFIEEIAEECGRPPARPDAQVVVLAGETDNENESEFGIEPDDNVREGVSPPWPEL